MFEYIWCCLQKFVLGIFDLLSKIIAGIDFPEDVAEVEYDLITSELQNAIEQIDTILKNVYKIY